MRKYKKILISVIVVVVIALGFVSNYFYDYAIARKEEQVEVVNERTQQNQTWFNQNAQEVSLISTKQFKLMGYEFKQSSNKWIIVVHGHRTRALKMANYVHEFYKLGYNVLAVDLIGHGKSEGDYATMGGYDSKDLAKWANYLVSKDANAEIVLFGISMGGATVLNSLDEDLPQNVVAFIEDSAYIKVDDEFTYQLHEQFNLPKYPFIPLASLVTKLRAGYFLSDIDATDAIKQTKLPALIIHGAKDDYVPLEYSQEVHELLNTNKQLIVYPEAKHCKSEELYTELYWKNINLFLNEHFKQDL